MGERNYKNIKTKTLNKLDGSTPKNEPALTLLKRKTMQLSNAHAKPLQKGNVVKFKVA